MRPSRVVEVDEGGKQGRPFSAVVVAADVCPFVQASLDEAFGFAVGLRSIRSCEAVLDAERQAGLGEEFRSIRRAVVGQQALDAYTDGGIVSNGVSQEGDGRVLAFVGMNLHEACPRVIVDGDMRERPSGTIDRVASIAGDPMAGPHDTTELLGIDVQELARTRMFVANDGRPSITRRLSHSAAVRMLIPAA